jgi:hypothetical protein
MSSSEQTSITLEGIFNALFDNLLDNERFQEAVSNSMNTYNEEIFKKNNDFVIDLQAIPCQKETKCLICLESILFNEMTYPLECLHLFHKSCLEQSIEHQHYECPLCKCKINIKKRIKLEDEYENNGHYIKLITKNE